MQQTIKIRSSEIKKGFIESHEDQRYILTTDGRKELIVHANTHGVHCLRLDLIYQSDVNGTATEEVLLRSLTG